MKQDTNNDSSFYESDTIAIHGWKVVSVYGFVRKSDRNYDFQSSLAQKQLKSDSVVIRIGGLEKDLSFYLIDDERSDSLPFVQNGHYLVGVGYQYYLPVLRKRVCGRAFKVVRGGVLWGYVYFKCVKESYHINLLGTSGSDIMTVIHSNGLYGIN